MAGCLSLGVSQLAALVCVVLLLCAITRWLVAFAEISKDTVASAQPSAESRPGVVRSLLLTYYQRDVLVDSQQRATRRV